MEIEKTSKTRSNPTPSASRKMGGLQSKLLQ
jgi:hypothetical protein